MTLIELTRKNTAWILLMWAILVVVLTLTLTFLIYRDTRHSQEKMKVQLLREIQEDINELKAKCL